MIICSLAAALVAASEVTCAVAASITGSGSFSSTVVVVAASATATAGAGRALLLADGGRKALPMS